MSNHYIYTVKEAAYIMRVSGITVRRMINSGKLKYIQMFKGSKLFVPESELVRLGYITKTHIEYDRKEGE